MKIVIDTLSNKKIKLDIDKNDKIKDIKLKIQINSQEILFLLVKMHLVMAVIFKIIAAHAMTLLLFGYKILKEICPSGQ